MLLPFALAGPELSWWLIGAAAVLMALGTRRKRSAVVAVCALSIACSSVPLLSRLATRQAREAAFQAVVPVTPQPGAAQIRPVRTRSDIAYPVRGATLHMTVYDPVESGKYPAIVMIYGGAWRSGSSGNSADFARHMASRGFVVCAIDYRHAPQFQFPVQLEDVQDALVFIQTHAAELQIDPTRLALLGRSSGGHLALLAAYQPTLTPVRAVVTFYAPTDLIGGYEDLPVPDPIHVRPVPESFMGGPPDRLKESYLRASPVTYANTPRPPTLLIQGGRDHIVKPRFARELNEKLRTGGTRSVLVEIPWAEHAFDIVFSGSGNREALDYIERFLSWTMQ